MQFAPNSTKLTTSKLRAEGNKSRTMEYRSLPLLSLLSLAFQQSKSLLLVLCSGLNRECKQTAKLGSRQSYFFFLLTRVMARSPSRRYRASELPLANTQTNAPQSPSRIAATGRLSAHGAAKVIPPNCSRGDGKSKVASRGGAKPPSEYLRLKALRQSPE